MKKTPSFFACALAVFSTLLLASPAVLARDAAAAGKIVVIDVAAGNNYGVRVYLAGSPTMCTGDQNFWAYLNETDSNYKVFVGALLAAKAQGSTVTIYSTLAVGACHIAYISVGA